MPKAQLYFDVGFVVVLVSLLVQGWSIAWAARLLHIALPRHDPLPRRVELDLPGQLAQEIVGYPVAANSPYLRRGLLPSWARPTLVVREEKILSPHEAAPVQAGDYVYLLAPPEKAQALDRFFVDMPPPAKPDPHLLGDFFVTGEHTLGELADIYGLKVSPAGGRHHARRLFRLRAQARAQAGRGAATRPDRARGPPGRRRPRRRPSACGCPRRRSRRRHARPDHAHLAARVGASAMKREVPDQSSHATCPRTRGSA